MPEITESFGSVLKRVAHEWKGRELRRTGKEPSQNQLAKFLGVTNTNLSMWMNDVRTPHGKALENLVEKLKAPELYDAAGVARRMPKSRKLYLLAAIWDHLSEEDQDKLYEQAKSIAENHGGETRGTTTA